MTPLLIVSPLELETLSIKSHFEKLGRELHPIKRGPLKAFELKKEGAYLITGGHGKVQFALSVQYLLQQFPQSRGVICAGCAGALSPEVQVGDLVIGLETVEHDYHLRFIQRPQPRFKGSPEWIAQLKDHAVSSKDHSVHFGTVASGDEDIVDAERALEVRTQTGGALAVAWEGAGGARASLWNQRPFLEIRAITDRADSEATVNFSENLKIVMPRLAEAIIALL